MHNDTLSIRYGITRILKVDIYGLSIDIQVYKVLCDKNFTHPMGGIIFNLIGFHKRGRINRKIRRYRNGRNIENGHQRY